MRTAVALFAAAYVGGYLLIKYKASRYLTQKIGYGGMVNLGFLLQLLMGGLFCMAVLGEMQGSLLGKIVVILLLCLPFIVLDPHQPRMLTMDPWPQIVFLAADGQKTIAEFIDHLARQYAGTIPETLDSTVVLLPARPSAPHASPKFSLIDEISSAPNSPKTS